MMRGLIEFVKRLIGFAIFLASVVLGIWITSGNDVGGIYLFFDIPSLLLVDLCVLGLGIIAFPGKAWAAGMRMLIGSCPEDRLHHAARFWRGMGYFAWVSAIVGFLIGGVIILQNLMDPSKIGPAFAVAVIPIFYAALTDAICRAIALRAESLKG